MKIYQFKPTFLYIKQHAITGKLYLGKTVKKDPIKYKGTGTRWSRHINKHGREHVVTLWYQLYDNPFDLVADALSMSHAFNIVKSESWLNLIQETGRNNTEGHWQNKSSPNKGKKLNPLSESHKKNISDATTGLAKSKEHKLKIGLGNKGKKKSKKTLSHSRNQSLAQSRILSFLSPEGFVIECSNTELIRTYNFIRNTATRHFEKFKFFKGFVLLGDN